jgi:hypothetical protein
MKNKMALLLIIIAWQCYCFILIEDNNKSKLNYCNNNLHWINIQLNGINEWKTIYEEKIFKKVNIEIGTGNNGLTRYYGINEWIECANGKAIRSGRKNEKILLNNYLCLYEKPWNDRVGYFVNKKDKIESRIQYINSTYLKMMELENKIIMHKKEYNGNENVRGSGIIYD